MSREGFSALKALAPTQSEPPFLLAELVALAVFAALTILAVIRFRNVDGVRIGRSSVSA